MNNLSELRHSSHFDIHQVMPSGAYLVRAGAAGAMVAGGWTAFSDVLRVRNHEITSQEAISRAVKNAALGAGAGAFIGAASHLARTYPLMGVAAVLAAGAGALYVAGRAQEAQKDQAASAPAAGTSA